MKRCEKCGALQKDSRFTCIDCGQSLGPPLSKEEEHRINQEIDSNIEKLSNKSDYFYVSKRDKVIAILHYINAIILISFMLFRKEDLWRTDMESIAFLGTLIMIAAPIDILFPKFMWELRSKRYSFHTEYLVPFGFGVKVKRFLGFFTLAIGYVFIIIILFNLYKV